MDQWTKATAAEAAQDVIAAVLPHMDMLPQIELLRGAVDALPPGKAKAALTKHLTVAAVALTREPVNPDAVVGALMIAARVANDVAKPPGN